MATIQIHPVKTRAHLKHAAAYIMDPNKTEDGWLVSSDTVLTSSAEDVYRDFLETKEHFGKTEGRQAYHLIQSFAPGEISPGLAQEIGKELAREMLPGYEVVVCTHTDRDHIHNHILINSVSYETGLKFRDPKDQSQLKAFQDFSDSLCRKYGLSVVEEPKQKKGRSPSYSEQHPERARKKTTKAYIYEDIDTAILAAHSQEDFWDILEYEMGYDVQRLTKSGQPLAHPKIRPQDSESGHYYRFDNFMEGYTEEDIQRRISKKLEAPPQELRATPAAPAQKKIPAQIQQTQPVPSFYKGGKGTYQEYQRSCAGYHNYFIRRYNWFGLSLAFVQYRYVLRRVEQQSYPRYATPQIRDAVRKLNQHSEETILLIRHNFHDLGELESHKAQLQKEISEIYKQINSRKGKLNRSRKTPLTEEEREQLQAEIRNLKQKVAPMVHEKKLCDDIEARSQRVAKTVEEERETALAELTPEREEREEGLEL